MESDAQGGISAVVGKILTISDPWWWLGALAILVGVPIFFLKLPETITAIANYHDMHRKTTHKIATERAKMGRAMAGRSSEKHKPLKEK